MFSSQSSVGGRREGGHLELQLNGATVRVPDFIQKMTLQMFQKEGIIQLFLQHTGPEVHNKFLLCSPEEQYVLVLSFFLHAGAWGDFSTAFLQHMDIWRAIWTASPESVVPGGVPRQETALIVVHVFTGMPTSMLAIRAASVIVAKANPGAMYRITSEHCVPLSPLGVRFTEDLVKRAMFQNVTIHGDVGRFGEAWATLLPTITGGKVLFVMHLPGINTTLPENRGTHDPCLRPFWRMHRIMVESSASLAGRLHYVVQFESADIRNEELTSRLMTPVRVDAQHYQRPPRPRLVFSSIPNFEIRRYTNITEPCPSYNAWQWNGREVGESINVKCPLIEITPEVIENAKQCVYRTSEPLSMDEHSSLQAMKAIHLPTQTPGLVPRAFYLDWMGCTPSMKPLWECVETVHECHQHIITSTGGPADPGAAYAKGCGMLRYCVRCEEMMKFIVSSGFCQGQVDCFASLLLTMTNGALCENLLKADTVHDCAVNCPLNPRPGF
jgi:hypothetical protein